VWRDSAELATTGASSRLILKSSSNLPNDHNDCPMVGANIGVFCPASSIGGTHRRVDCGGSSDLELKGMREDTRHEIYTGSGS
jgi:hypothetical protein